MGEKLLFIHERIKFLFPNKNILVDKNDVSFWDMYTDFFTSRVEIVFFSRDASHSRRAHNSIPYDMPVLAQRRKIIQLIFTTNGKKVQFIARKSSLFDAFRPCEHAFHVRTCSVFFVHREPLK